MQAPCGGAEELASVCIKIPYETIRHGRASGCKGDLNFDHLWIRPH